MNQLQSELVTVHYYLTTVLLCLSGTFAFNEMMICRHAENRHRVQMVALIRLCRFLRSEPAASCSICDVHRRSRGDLFKDVN